MARNSVIQDALFVKHLTKKSKEILRTFLLMFKKKKVQRPKGLILIAEDDELHKKINEKIIKRSGYEVILTENGFDTLEKFITFKNRIDLVLLDAGLPGMSGIDICREIREMGFPSIPIILLTATVEYFAPKANVVGMSACMAKPLTISSWDDICKRWLKK